MAKKKIDKFPEMSESELLYELLWKKYNAIDLHKLIHVGQSSDGLWSVKVGGKVIKGTELTNLQNEAQMIKQTQLWKMMVEAKKNAAHAYMFTQMKTLDDSHYGKTMLYNLSIDEQIFLALENVHEAPKPHAYAKTQYPSQT